MTRADEIFAESRVRRHRRTSQLFLWLFVAQWVFAVVLALIGPFDAMVAAAAGGALSIPPIVLILTRPEWWLTRHVVAFLQMVWSAHLIDIAGGGGIETNFHVFGSLALLAFYLDWKLLPTATVVLLVDHLVEGRFMELTTCLTVEDLVLAWVCVRGIREAREMADREARLEHMEGTDAIPFDYSLGELASELHADDRKRVIAAFAAFDGKKDVDPIEFRIANGGPHIAHVRAFLGHRRGNRVRGVMFDETTHKRLEAELRHAQQLESIGRVAAGVAHEINTPIQFVGDSVEFATQAFEAMIEVMNGKRERDDDVDYVIGELPRALERVRDGAERVANIVRSMKVFARPPQPVMDLVDLNEAIESTLVIARNEYKYVADLKLDLQPLPEVACHVGEINQVVLNMIVNAAHAIGATQRRGTITVKTRSDDRYIVISIADDGCGIPDTIRDKIFEPFFTTKPVGKGTGQGLAIARSVIVDGHGGKLTFRSAVGHGTTFHIRIPLEPSQQLGAAA